MTTTFAILIVRGNGSSLYRKNLYPLLGKPVLTYALETCRKARCIDETFVWSEDEEVLTLAQKTGAHPLKRPKEMVHYYNGITTQDQWRENQFDQIEKRVGTRGDFIVAFNCNNIFLKTDTLEKMSARLKGTPSAMSILAVRPVHPRLCLCNDKTSYLFPFWNASNFKFSGHPQLYRQVGVSISRRTAKPPGPHEKYGLPCGKRGGRVRFSEPRRCCDSGIFPHQTVG